MKKYQLIISITLFILLNKNIICNQSLNNKNIDLNKLDLQRLNDFEKHYSHDGNYVILQYEIR